MQQAKRSSLPVISFFSDKQQGATFGERLCHAIEQGFASGYQRLIICGTDSPDVNSEQFTTVAKKLQSHSLVLGPSVDGGVYLIGIDRAAYSSQAFLQIPWLTESVFESLRSYGSQNFLQVAIENEQRDIDDIEALFQWQLYQSKHWFGRLLDLLINDLKNTRNRSVYNAAIQCLFTSHSALRGPPKACF